MKYNLARLETLAEGDKDFIVRVLNVFITEVTADIQKMQDAFESEDILDISALAHKIKPNLILFGLDQATAISIRLEKNRFRPLSLSILKSQLDELQTSVAEVVVLLKKDFLLV